MLQHSASLAYTRPTAVGGIPERTAKAALCRLNMNNPPTALVGFEVLLEFLGSIVRFLPDMSSLW